MTKQQDLYNRFLKQVTGGRLYRPTSKLVHEPSKWRVLSVAVQLPSGAVEIITNHHNLEEKIMYYLEKYDGEFRMVNNPEVQIIGYMLV